MKRLISSVQSGALCLNHALRIVFCCVPDPPRRPIAPLASIGIADAAISPDRRSARQTRSSAAMTVIAKLSVIFPLGEVFLGGYVHTAVEKKILRFRIGKGCESQTYSILIAEIV